jgi:carboxymethylenebutenolidase
MKTAHFSQHLTGVRNSLLVASVMCASHQGFSQSAQGGLSQTWASQQKSQAWATRKLEESLRHHEWVTIPNGNRTLNAFITYPDVNEKAPVLLVLHEVFGLTDSTRNTADEVAAMGYITIAPDMLSGHGPNGGGTSSFPTTRAASDKETSVSDDDVFSDLNAWAAYGLKLPRSNGKFAIVGLTWGGGAAFRYAASKAHSNALKAVYLFYGVGPWPPGIERPVTNESGLPPLPVNNINVPIYGFYASTDTRVESTLEATKTAMNAAGKVYEPVVYDGADHAFLRIGEDPSNKNPANALAVKESLARLERLLKKL